MAFGVQDFHDLVRVLEEHPEWRADLRRLVLTEDLLELPAVVRELAEAQRRADERLGGVEERLGGVEERLGRLADAVIGLAEAQGRTEERLGRLEDALAALAEAQGRTEERVSSLAEAQQLMIDRLGRLSGRELERFYRERAGAYFSRLLRRIRPLTSAEVADLLDEPEAGALLSETERQDVLRADLVVRGRRREDGSTLYLVVEVSVGIGSGDVERAERRAGLLGRIQSAIPVVAGEGISPEAMALAENRGVWRVLDGQILAPGAA